MVGNRRLEDNESTQSAEATEEDDESTQSASEDSGVERAPGYKANLKWCTDAGPRSTNVKAMQPRGDGANRKKRLRDGSPDHLISEMVFARLRSQILW